VRRSLDQGGQHLDSAYRERKECDGLQQTGGCHGHDDNSFAAVRLLLLRLPEMPVWSAAGERVYVPMVQYDERTAVACHYPADRERLDVYFWKSVSDLGQWFELGLVVCYAINLYIPIASKIDFIIQVALRKIKNNPVIPSKGVLVNELFANAVVQAALVMASFVILAPMITMDKLYIKTTVQNIQPIRGLRRVYSIVK
jgi:hypothetical protein